MTLSKTKINIGMVRYAEIYRPTNALSAARLSYLFKKVGFELEDFCESPIIKRSTKAQMTKLARSMGYEIHWFEKGLGR